MPDQDPTQTTTFRAKLPGGALFEFATKNPMIVLWAIFTVGTIFIGLRVWDIGLKLDLLDLRMSEMARGMREQTCLQYVPEAERHKYVGQAAACKRMGELQ